MSALPKDRPRVTEDGVLCTQCWNRKDPSEFKRHDDGAFHTQCLGCRSEYRNWMKLSPEAKALRVAERTKAFETEESYRVRFVARASNRKLGPMPVTWTARGSCPDSCSLKSAGCYAEVGLLRMHWAKVPGEGLTWKAFCRKVAALPAGTTWRHNEAGDLPGRGDAIDAHALRQLVDANRGRRGFSFSHKPVLATKALNPRARGGIPTDAERRLWTASNRFAVAEANRRGFTINLSADSLAEADALARLHIAPVVVVLPADAPARPQKTPEGRPIVVCPAELQEGMTCLQCQLCAKADRASIVGFLAHGQSKAVVSQIVRARRTA